MVDSNLLVQDGNIQGEDFALGTVLVEDELRDIGADSSKYQGEYVDGKKNGYGIYNFAHGSIYEGDWSDDMINGRGVWI